MRTRAPNGWMGWNFWRKISLASGRYAAIITAPIPGMKSATGEVNSQPDQPTTRVIRRAAEEQASINGCLLLCCSVVAMLPWLEHNRWCADVKPLVEPGCVA